MEHVQLELPCTIYSWDTHRTCTIGTPIEHVQLKHTCKMFSWDSHGTCKVGTPMENVQLGNPWNMYSWDSHGTWKVETPMEHVQLRLSWNMYTDGTPMEYVQTTRHAPEVCICIKTVKCSKMKKRIVKNLRLSINKGLMFKLSVSNWRLDHLK